MATGDQNDILNRLLAVMPPWFGDPSSDPILNGVLIGYAQLGGAKYSDYLYTLLQTRINTATDTFLDLIAFDFFGVNLARGNGETDMSFRNRILGNLFPEYATRPGMSHTLQVLTGRTPNLFEPRRPADCGGLSTGGVGWGVAGGWGNLEIPYNGLVNAFRPLGTGTPGVDGYNNGAGGYSTTSYFAYTNISQVTQQVTDAQIYAAADAAKVAGTEVWVRISS